MDRFERLYKLYRALRARRYPVSCDTLKNELGCSEVTSEYIASIIERLQELMDGAGKHHAQIQ